MPNLFRVVAVLACVLSSIPQVQASDEDIIFKPLASGPPKLMVLIPGGKVPNVNYTNTALAIQKATEMSLWIVVPAVFERLCIIQCSGKGACLVLHQAVEGAIAKAVKAGFPLVDKSRDVFIGGHSLGGTCGNYLMQGYPGVYAGLVIMGSYVDSKGPGSLVNYTAPVILIGAELDGGLAKPVNMALWWMQFEEVLVSKGRDTAIRNKSVVILPSIDHSDFCPGYAVPGDLPSELDSATALNTYIGPTVAAFLHLHSGMPTSVQQKAIAKLTNAIAQTRTLMTPIVRAFDLEVDGGIGIIEGGASSPWCITAQHRIGGLSATDDANLFIKNKYTNSSTGEGGFEHTRVGYKVSGSQLLLNTSGHNAYERDVEDTATTNAAKEIGCKLVSSGRIEQQLNVTAVTKGVTCGDVNKYAVEKMKDLLQSQVPKTLQRYETKGRGFCWKPDFSPPGDIGPLFIAETLELKENATCLSVASLTISTTISSKIFPGVHYCKLLSPAKVMDWIYTVSMKTPETTSNSYLLSSETTHKGINVH
ncbi:hypothetical protein CYMTET_33245 [Cymbomonas tetramitiformis]|uniref:Chlorophyllase n=1 Tax=Cymbomonas tetramitiformis TaxID=36881 RepID=A0AAE0FDF3_9CHLO|nr:hypothetical protein CYMTET_33245 [Cymbomonas tetramitiformis]